MAQNVERPNLINRIKNTSYIFVPFVCAKNTDFSNIDIYWRAKSQNNKYFLKYIVDKLIPESNSVCCRPYLMDDNVRSDLGIIESSCNCYIETMKYAEGVTFSLRINEILLFMFDTNIGFIVYKIEHESTDSAYRIASKNYHLKKIHNTILYTRKDDGTNSTLVIASASINSLSTLTEYILNKTISSETQIFFNYCEKSERRSNILTHYNLKLEHKLCDDDQDEIDKILFYLKRNYHYQWDRDAGDKIKNEEYFRASPYIHWGITSEATICLTLTDPETYFISNSFYDNYHSYYLYIYILALHQKYALYYFLTKFSVNSNIEQLESYLSELADFRAKYVFQIISESETYQTVYNKTRNSFALDNLFTDIDEQVNRVIDIKKVINDKKNDKQANHINLILGILTFFSLFSALVDLNTLIDWLKIFLTESQLILLKYGLSGFIILIAIILFVQFIKLSHNKK